MVASSGHIHSGFSGKIFQQFLVTSANRIAKKILAKIESLKPLSS
jgi:hypothetical protein